MRQVQGRPAHRPPGTSLPTLYPPWAPPSTCLITGSPPVLPRTTSTRRIWTRTSTRASCCSSPPPPPPQPQRRRQRLHRQRQAPHRHCAEHPAKRVSRAVPGGPVPGLPLQPQPGQCGQGVLSRGAQPAADRRPEQLTLNQWVLGSSPRWRTKKSQQKKLLALFTLLPLFTKGKIG